MGRKPKIKYILAALYLRMQTMNLEELGDLIGQLESLKIQTWVRMIELTRNIAPK